jgi:GT2 family glycosyltransferase
VPDRSPRTTVVVVTWRGLDLIGACLDALAAQTTPHRVLVVDNASTDGTAAVLATRPVRAARPVRVVRLRRNAGYAGALAAVLPGVDTPYVAWLNDDAEPEPGWLAALESTLDGHPDVAAAGSVLLDGGGAVQSAGVRLTPLGEGADVIDVPAPGEVFGFCGGAALLRTGALRAAGGVPAGFFCYYEDTDTSWRLRLAGHRIVTAPGARVRHRHGASSEPGSGRFHRWNERNRLLMLLRCAPAGVALRELARFTAITAALPVRRWLGAVVPVRRWLGAVVPVRRWQDAAAPTQRWQGAVAPARQRVPEAANFRLALRLRVLAEVAVRLPPALVARARIGRRTAVPRARVWCRWARADTASYRAWSAGEEG